MDGKDDDEKLREKSPKKLEFPPEFDELEEFFGPDWPEDYDD